MESRKKKDIKRKQQLAARRLFEFRSLIFYTTALGRTVGSPTTTAGDMIDIRTAWAAAITQLSKENSPQEILTVGKVSYNMVNNIGGYRTKPLYSGLESRYYCS